ncbi:hypothetical protein GGR50DRAFT_681838 [Xylaria sp. CBS 124048]|nr:hypothetical protein GGR50DRAFT_681838 [Xylaria sp. CBS 124048]
MFIYLFIFLLHTSQLQLFLSTLIETEAAVGSYDKDSIASARHPVTMFMISFLNFFFFFFFFPSSRLVSFLSCKVWVCFTYVKVSHQTPCLPPASPVFSLCEIRWFGYADAILDTNNKCRAKNEKKKKKKKKEKKKEKKKINYPS